MKKYRLTATRIPPSMCFRSFWSIELTMKTAPRLTTVKVAKIGSTLCHSMKRRMRMATTRDMEAASIPDRAVASP